MLDEVLWSQAQLGIGINRLAQQLGSNSSHEEPHGRTLEQMAYMQGLEAVPLQSTYGGLQDTLRQFVPGVLEVYQAGEPAYLLISARKKRHLKLLAPNGGHSFYSIDQVVEILRVNRGMAPPASVDSLLDKLGLSGKRLAHARDLLIEQQLGAHIIGKIWLLRPHPARGLKTAIRYARLGYYALGFILAYILERMMLIVGIGVLGYAIAHELWIFPLLVTWLLIVCSHWAFSALVKACQLQLNVRTGIIIKRQLQYSALHLQSEAIATKGPAQLLGQALEVENLHSNTLTGLFTAVNAAIDLLIAFVILSLIGAWDICFLLGIFVIVTGVIVSKFTYSYEIWAKQRVKLSHLTIEHIQGNRTRLIQSNPERWHKREETDLYNYWLASIRMDKYAFLLQAVIPGVWLTISGALLCLSIYLGTSPLVELASLLGVVLLVWQSWHSVADSGQQLARTWYSWKQVSILLGQVRPTVLIPLAKIESPQAQQVSVGLEAKQLCYSYAPSRSVIHKLDILLKRKSRYLLQGESGSGKSTLFGLLSGQITQQQGLLLFDGCDIKSWGDEHWRKKICWVPQFHENYIFSGSLLYNLMLGRNWPPSQQDVEDALDVCESLGLFPLIRKMPARLLQPIGEMGWQLSHGEASRVHLARALLQNPDFLLVDESLGALDVNTSRQILTYLEGCPPAIVLCMHP